MSENNPPNPEITIQSLLEAPEETRRIIWQLMANVTELINSLLHYINAHPDFDTWMTEWEIPSSIIDSFLRNAKTQSPYREMPSRFITSAQNLIKDIFKSWFENQRLRRVSLWSSNAGRNFPTLLCQK